MDEEKTIGLVIKYRVILINSMRDFLLEMKELNSSHAAFFSSSLLASLLAQISHSFVKDPKDKNTVLKIIDETALMAKDYVIEAINNIERCRDG